MAINITKYEPPSLEEDAEFKEGFASLTKANHTPIEQEAVKAPSEPQPVEPASNPISDEEISAYRQAGFDDGYQQGYAKAQEELNNDLLQTNQKIIDSLLSADTKLEAMQQRMTQQQKETSHTTVKLAMMLAQKITFSHLENEPTGAMINAVQKCLAELQGASDITLNVHPDMIAPLDKRLQTIAMQQGSHLNIDIQPSEKVAKGDCHIAWENGGATFEQASLWQEMDVLLEQYKLLPTVVE